MELPEEYAGPVEDLCELYNVAEVDLKNVGRVKDVLIVTGVNQLRYAGQHLVRALTSQQPDEILADLDAAKRHAQRAIYDINDSAVQFYLRRIDELRETQFPRVDFAATIPSYGDIVEKVRRARASLEVTEDSQHDRAQFYEQAREHVQELKIAWDTFQEHQPDLVRALKRANSARLFSWLGIAITAVAAAVFTALRFF